MSNTIKCPTCSHEFAIEDVLVNQFEEKYNTKLVEQENTFKAKMEELDKAKQEFEAKKEKENILFKERLNKKLEEERQQIENKAKEEFEGKIKYLETENEKQKNENKTLKEKELELLKKEGQLKDAQENLELELAKRIVTEKERLEKEIKAKEQLRLETKQEELKKQITDEFQLKMAELEQENEKKRQENIELKKKELEIQKKEQLLKEERELFELEMQRKLFEEKEIIVQQTRKQEQEKVDLKVKEYEKKLEDQKRLIEEMQRKAQQGSMQMQGEIQELALEDVLRHKFPLDIIDEVGKGVRGADVVQSVVNDFQQICGKIIYESKRTKAFTEGWIDKLKEDMREQSADIAVIVTETLPRDMERFGRKNGVWICTFHEVENVIFVLREMLLREHAARAASQNKGGKMELLYNYLVSEEFKQRVEGIVSGFSTLQQEMNREKRAMQKIWKEREKQIEKVITNTVDMYGSIRGIAGNAIAPVKELELLTEADELELDID
ncbi:DUF2130 domain-containing protein [Bacteroidales bacterium OttesenSCG-928-C19]|nr:DUF2130 domain-containing protein [Bacteroidales bacterium OttesenSCG-928-C19]